ncbi:putative SP-containing protein [Vairimorpha necatrix]|uniref:SP-containing protein n=1 Tax=Vairimorpha necatrix TaxID=6039 RepID=A0AAX4JB76_9MICR
MNVVNWFFILLEFVKLSDPISRDIRQRLKGIFNEIDPEEILSNLLKEICHTETPLIEKYTKEEYDLKEFIVFQNVWKIRFEKEVEKFIYYENFLYNKIKKYAFDEINNKIKSLRIYKYNKKKIKGGERDLVNYLLSTKKKYEKSMKQKSKSFQKSVDEIQEDLHLKKNFYGIRMRKNATKS